MVYVSSGMDFHIGRALKAAIAYYGYQQKEIAEMTGTAQADFNNFLNGMKQVGTGTLVEMLVTMPPELRATVIAELLQATTQLAAHRKAAAK